MAVPRFVWTDLSTFDVREATRFYSKVFGWKFWDQDGYQLARRRSTVLAGVYEMPEPFQSINMPSFWMSYVAVDDVAATVERARQHPQAIIEVESDDFGDGRVALIRDPAGAGSRSTKGRASTRAEPLQDSSFGTTSSRRAPPRSKRSTQTSWVGPSTPTATGGTE